MDLGISSAAILRRNHEGHDVATRAKAYLQAGPRSNFAIAMKIKLFAGNLSCMDHFGFVCCFR